jgi:hypothetical protein
MLNTPYVKSISEPDPELAECNPHYQHQFIKLRFSAYPLSPLHDASSGCGRRRHGDTEDSYKLGGMLTTLVKRSYTGPVFYLSVPSVYQKDSL